MKFLITGLNEFDSNKFIFNPENGLNSKPQSALWASPLQDNTSPWEQWCIQNDFRISSLKKRTIVDINLEEVFIFNTMECS